MNISPLQLLNSCQTLRQLRSIHARLLVDSSISSSDIIINRLIRLYSRLGSICFAQKLFDETTQTNSHLWTSLIHGLVENHHCPEALSIFQRMHREAVPILNFTLSSVLKGLSRQDRLRDGIVLHGLVVKFGFVSDLVVVNATIDLYMRYGKVGPARRLFDDMDEWDIVTWNLMISGYGNNKMVGAACELFNEMPERNVISWTSLICAYIKVGDMLEARSLFEAMPTKDLASWNVMISGYMDMGDIFNARTIFDRMPKCNTSTWNIMISGFSKAGNMGLAKEFFDRMPSRNIASWTMMIDGYIKAGDIDMARSLFDQMPEKNLITWSAMIGGYAKNGQPQVALCLFEKFKSQGIEPDETFMLGLISACSQLGTLETAETVIGSFLDTGQLSNLQLATGLIDMYSKCGSIEKGFHVFKLAHKKDLLCYSAMISAFANHGLGQKALDLFDEMLMEKIIPDGVIFLAVLGACNHGGLVCEGRKYFKLMKEEYLIHPSDKHYACMVDLLGRAGCLGEAYDLIMNMPASPSAILWGALLSACRVHQNVELAEIAASELFNIEPNNSGNYVLLSNIYADARRWDEVAKVRALMIKGLHVRKNRGSSWIELDFKLHEFVKADVSHAQSKSIYSILELLMNDMLLFRQTADEFGQIEEVELNSS